MDALLDDTAIGAVMGSCLPRNSTLSDLYAGLSDEVCRPLIALRAGCDLLLAGCEGPISAEQSCHVWALRSQCDELLRLTRTYLLDYAGLPRSTTKLHWAEFRLGALMEEADRQFAGLAESRGIAWSCLLEASDGGVQTDLACFQKVLSQLVENALSHTPEGGRVVVSGRILGDRWRIEVVDDGPGIPVEALQIVLEPLVKLGPCPAQGSRRGRHGMGLAVCRELVGRLGGVFELRSGGDDGTSATLQFPVDRPGESPGTSSLG